MQGNGELEDIEILLSFYDNINRVWLCLSLLHKASSILLVFTVCPHRDPVRVHYISCMNILIFSNDINHDSFKKFHYVAGSAKEV